MRCNIGGGTPPPLPPTTSAYAVQKFSPERSDADNADNTARWVHWEIHLQICQSFLFVSHLWFAVRTF